jgi:hypothetical protein
MGEWRGVKAFEVLSLCSGFFFFSCLVFDIYIFGTPCHDLDLNFGIVGTSSGQFL